MYIFKQKPKKKPKSKRNIKRKHEVDQISQALHVLNINSKSSTHKLEFYLLKNTVIKKLLSEGLAHKIGIHMGYTVIKCGVYLFHAPSTPEDLQNLPQRSVKQTKNPSVEMPTYIAEMHINNFLRN